MDFLLINVTLLHCCILLCFTSPCHAPTHGHACHGSSLGASRSLQGWQFAAEAVWNSSTFLFKVAMRALLLACYSQAQRPVHLTTAPCLRCRQCDGHSGRIRSRRSRLYRLSLQANAAKPAGAAAEQTPRADSKVPACDPAAAAGQHQAHSLLQQLKRGLTDAPAQPAQGNCYGCGIPLQTHDPELAGFVPLEKYQVKKAHRQLDQLLCKRWEGGRS